MSLIRPARVLAGQKQAGLQADTSWQAVRSLL
jgi:hypothetical protein